jgi:hypothetical protein
MPYIGNPIYQSAFVTDTFSGTGSQTAFTMSVAPAGTTNVLVVVSGVVQDPSTYGVVGNTLNFTTAPPTGTGNISCRYLGVPVTGVTTTAYRTLTEFTATSGQTTFTPPSYTVGYILVFRNGVLLGSADYTASNGTTVVLATGATAGDLVTVESFLVSSVLNAISNSAGSVSASNLAGGAALSNIGAGNITSTYLGNLTTLPVSGGYTLTLPSSTGTLLTTAIPSSSSGTATAASVGSNSYTNIVSSLSLPNKSYIIAQFEITTSNSNNPSDATYGMYISTGATAASRVAYQDGVNVYPKSGIAQVAGSLSYFNISGSTQSIWLAGYPYASANYNTPTYTVKYYIVSFS